mmetsp:Transcript_20091/g.52551  ORF Transcript_20091/g.52551 Transcript_20091/m.52551 type:complete len:453 (+) Transcript_20091:93-1451(+)
MQGFSELLRSSFLSACSITLAVTWIEAIKLTFPTSSSASHATQYTHVLLNALVIHAMGAYATSHVLHNRGVPIAYKPTFIGPVNAITGWVWRDAVLEFFNLQIGDSKSGKIKLLIFGVGGALVALLHIYATRVAHHHLTKAEDSSRMQHVKHAVAKSVEGASILPMAAFFRRFCDFVFAWFFGNYIGDIGLTFFKALAIWALLGVVELACLTFDPVEKAGPLSPSERKADEAHTLQEMLTMHRHNAFNFVAGWQCYDLVTCGRNHLMDAIGGYGQYTLPLFVVIYLMIVTARAYFIQSTDYMNNCFCRRPSAAALSAADASFGDRFANYTTICYGFLFNSFGFQLGCSVQDMYLMPLTALTAYYKPAALVVAWLVVGALVLYLSLLLRAAHAEIKKKLEKIMSLEMSVGMKGLKWMRKGLSKKHIFDEVTPQPDSGSSNGTAKGPNEKTPLV